MITDGKRKRDCVCVYFIFRPLVNSLYLQSLSSPPTHYHKSGGRCCGPSGESGPSPIFLSRKQFPLTTLIFGYRRSLFFPFPLATIVSCYFYALPSEPVSFVTTITLYRTSRSYNQTEGTAIHTPIYLTIYHIPNLK